MLSARFLALALCFLAVLLGGCSSSSGGSELPTKVSTLANQCVSSAASDGTRFITRTQSGDAFEASASAGLEQASRFHLRAADLGTYLLFDRDEQYLVSDGSLLQRASALESDTVKVGDVIEIDDEFQSEGEWEVESLTGRFWLRHMKSGGYLSGSGVVAERRDVDAVELVEQSGCATFPELTVDAEGVVDPIEFEDGSVFGFAETHTHLLTNFGFAGGGLYHGSAFHRLGVEHALPDCEIPHGEEGRKDLLGYSFDNRGLSVQQVLLPLVAGETPGFNHATEGYPAFTSWPNARESATHQTQYYKWIERAHLAGMRLLVQHAMTMKFLCDTFVALGNKPARFECNDMVSVDRIIEETYNLERYIDAQSGGPGEGWFRIVKSPAEAREVIRAGKLAVLLGIETSFLFDCFLVPRSGFERCDEATVIEKLDEYYDKGVRVLFPNHKFDSAFSAGDGDKRFIDIGNFALTGHWSNFVECSEDLQGLPSVFDDGGLSFPGINMPREVYDSTPPELENVRDYEDDPIGTLVQYLDQLSSEGPRDGEYCQNAGLTPLGERLIEEMMKRGIVIEIDHLPRLAYRRAFEMLVENDYPAVGTHGNNNDGLLYELGGVSKSGFGRCRSATEPATMDDGYQARIQLMRDKGAFPAEGFGFDFNGFAGAPGPRFGNESNCENQEDRISYPFTSYAGDITFQQPKLGNRSVDFNTEGMIHLGLVAELIEEVRRDGVSDEDLEPLFKSAEGYLRMWEKAERRGAALSSNPSSQRVSR
ncbi:MAG: hypothetical protein ACN4G0_07715 [Polyangiales bacterium]